MRIALLFCTVFWAGLAVALSGCEVYVGTRRIDHVEQTQTMTDKPWYCAYFDCRGSNDK